MWCNAAYWVYKYTIMVMNGNSVTLRSKYRMPPKCNKSMLECKVMWYNMKKCKKCIRPLAMITDWQYLTKVCSIDRAFCI